MTGTELKRVRVGAGHTQASLAAALGLNPNTVARMEQGNLAIRAVVALAVASVCSVPQPKEGHRERKT
jgi:DNA-binding XRE family transcriptional regulator